MIDWIKAVLVGVSVILFSFENGEDIRYFQPSTIPIVDSTDVVSVSINDSLADQKIFQARTSSDTPLYYYSELQTGVCYDNTCRPLNIMVYWNITGRYLGYELKNGEFLSKYDHEPFTQKEYEQLNNLLADPFLPLGNYAFEDLVKIPDTVKNSVDGVSGATAKDVLDYVVEGAAYTTHKLWHVVHGPVQQQVMDLTESDFDSFLFNKILQSTNQSDRTWALERVALLSELDDSVIDALIRILLEGEYFQSYLLLKSLSSDQLESEDLQLKLFNLIGKVDHGIENMIFDQLIDAPHLYQKVVDHSISILRKLSGVQLVRLLKLYSHHEVKEAGLNEELSKMIPNENNFVEKQVLQFLENHTNRPDQIKNP
ncbi:MAG: hypothetical protein WDZ72_11810 [Cyclobacteriaceae bacterium]